MTMDGRSDPRKLMRLSDAERTLIRRAVTEHAEVHLLSEDELELAADLIARMS